MTQLILISVLVLVQSLAFAQRKDPDVQKLNKKVAQILNGQKPRGIKTLAAQIKSPRDRAAFQSVFASKKGKSIKLHGFFDQLYILEGKKITSLRLISQKPLIVEINGARKVKVNPNNILSSFVKTQAHWLNWLLPKASAFFNFGGNDENEWGFLYSSVMSVDPAFVLDMPAVDSAADAEGRLADDIQSFVSDLGIQSFNCERQRSDLANADFLSFTDNRGNDFFISDQGFLSPMLEGSPIEFYRRMTHLEGAIKESYSDLARRVGQDPELDLSHFQLDCSQTSRLENNCRFHIVDEHRHRYTDTTIDRLSRTNIHTQAIGNRLDRELGRNITEFYELRHQISDRVNERAHETIQNPTPHVLRAIALCCEDQRCRSEARQGPGLDMRHGQGTGTRN
jgi:hypothetical protein